MIRLTGNIVGVWMIVFSNLLVPMSIEKRRFALNLKSPAIRQGSGMTPQQIQLVKTSWREVLPIREQAAQLFYGKLFEMDPALKQLFTGDIAEQGRKLMQMLNTVVQKLDQLNELLPQVRDLAKRHVQYGVKDSDYDTVGAAFLWTLETGLGDGFTPDVSEAWNTAYMALSDAMRRDVKDSIQPG